MSGRSAMTLRVADRRSAEPGGSCLRGTRSGPRLGAGGRPGGLASVGPGGPRLAPAAELTLLASGWPGVGRPGGLASVGPDGPELALLGPVGPARRAGRLWLPLTRSGLQVAPGRPTWRSGLRWARGCLGWAPAADLAVWLPLTRSGLQVAPGRPTWRSGLRWARGCLGWAPAADLAVWPPVRPDGPPVGPDVAGLRCGLRGGVADLAVWPPVARLAVASVAEWPTWRSGLRWARGRRAGALAQLGAGGSR
jgi:hypothetical protein